MDSTKRNKIEAVNVNAHLHTPYSFSAFDKLTDALDRAVAENVRVVGVNYFYSMDDIPPTQDLYLKGFKWEGARRPVQADVFDRRIRPSQRKERTRLRHPDFPILMRIEEHKKRLIEQRRWADRNDQVDPLTVEWMRELGYEVGQPREPQRPAPQAE